MTKICFMLTSNSGIGTTTIFATHARRNIDDLLAYFSEYYNVTANYPEDKDTVDILVIPDSFGAFINERNLPVIKVPTILFLERDFEKIKVYIDNYFLEISKIKIQIDKI